MNSGATRRIVEAQAANFNGAASRPRPSYAGGTHGVHAASPRLLWRARPENDGVQRKPEHRMEVRLGVVHCFQYVFAEERFLHGGLWCKTRANVTQKNGLKIALNRSGILDDFTPVFQRGSH